MRQVTWSVAAKALAIVVLVFATGCSASSRGRPNGSDGDDGGASGMDLPMPGGICKVQDDSNGFGRCDRVAPPMSFEPDLQWSWTGPDGDIESIVMPLVANLTDDNGDGAVDLCDVPDVVVVASASAGPRGSAGHIYLLDGRTGAQELRIETVVDSSVTPALGDLDHDGIPEIVTVDTDGHLYAFDHRGMIKWGPAGQWAGDWYAGAIALADLDHDGEVEIIGGNTVFDHNGAKLWTASHPQAQFNATTIADLDGDGLQEVVLGAAAYHHDGRLFWSTTLDPGYPQVANLDADPDPEVLLTNRNGLSVIEHDGKIKYSNLRPTPDNGQPSKFTWVRPATIHDFNGDGTADYAMSSASYYSLYNADGSLRWFAPISDASGIAAGTAFDFLGDGSAEAMYADEKNLLVFDATGQPILTVPRTSGTLTEYPVVADIDNDGSAEIVVVSNGSGGPSSPTVQVIRDKQDRWIQARRIWNQHTYHVTNVREDGTIPQFEQPSWKRLNTFRTNAQINGTGVCQPPIG